jgi:hypothetical protein
MKLNEKEGKRFEDQSIICCLLINLTLLEKKFKYFFIGVRIFFPVMEIKPRTKTGRLRKF